MTPSGAPNCSRCNLWMRRKMIVGSLLAHRQTEASGWRPGTAQNDESWCVGRAWKGRRRQPRGGEGGPERAEAGLKLGRWWRALLGRLGRAVDEWRLSWIHKEGFI